MMSKTSFMGHRGDRSGVHKGSYLDLRLMSWEVSYRSEIRCFMEGLVKTDVPKSPCIYG